MNNFTWLQRWYLSHCDGAWEHRYGITIESLDNPGWRAAIDLTDTELVETPFLRLEIKRSETDWLQCWVAESKFHLACGPENLDEAIGVFKTWAETAPAAGRK